MSTVEKVITPEPRRPWAPSPLDRSKTAGIIAGAALISFTLVAITPLEGKLAYAAIFFVAYLVIDFVVSFLKAGRQLRLIVCFGDLSLPPLLSRLLRLSASWLPSGSVATMVCTGLYLPKICTRTRLLTQ